MKLCDCNIGTRVAVYCSAGRITGTIINVNGAPLGTATIKDDRNAVLLAHPHQLRKLKAVKRSKSVAAFNLETIQTIRYHLNTIGFETFSEQIRERLLKAIELLNRITP